MSHPRTIRVVAFDGGLSHMGAVLAEVSEVGFVRVLDARVFATEKGEGVAKKIRGTKRSTASTVTSSADNRRRVREMVAHVDGWQREGDGARALRTASIVVVEAFSAPPNAAAGAKLAMSLSMVETLCGLLGVPTVEVAPQTIKSVMGVPRGLAPERSKRAVQVAVDLFLFGGGGTLAEKFLQGENGGDHEHPYDAAAAIITAVERDRFRSVLPIVT